MSEFRTSREEDPLVKSWEWQLANSHVNLESLSKVIKFTEDERENLLELTFLPMRITPYYAEVIKNSSALRKTVIPSIFETIKHEKESSDPLKEEESSICKDLVHKYPDRVLFLVTNFCSNYCRYCTRSRYIEKNISDWDKPLVYIREHTEIRDVLLSGGDPLTMKDDKIEYLLSELRKIPHVEIIRIGTKVPMVMPQRITDDLVNMIKKYHPVYMSVHCTHPDEITPEVKEACNKIANAGIVMRSQTVLLKDVNDSSEVMKNLMQKLLSVRISPYYLYSCDRIEGSNHFFVDPRKGIEIIKDLRGWTSGYAIPQFIIDSELGKIPVNPDYCEFKDDKTIIKNYKEESVEF